MTTNPGVSLLSISLALVAASAGLAVGAGVYAFHYAKGTSYLGNDPASCANCHVMESHYAGWQAAPHHGVATCNDCHAPVGPIAKYLVKTLNGYKHSMAFTLGDYHEVVRARPMSTSVVEANCRHCHAELVDIVAHDRGASCVRCHASVGHLR